MNSKERILTAIHHQEPDGVPVDLGATPSSGISAIAYAKLKQHLGIWSGHTRVYDVIQQLAQSEYEILDRYHIDVLELGGPSTPVIKTGMTSCLPQGISVQFPAWFKPVLQSNCVWDAFDAEGTRIATMPESATFFDQTSFPYLDGYPENYHNLGYLMSKVHWGACAQP